MFGEFNMDEGINSEVGDIALEIPKLKIKIEMWEEKKSNTQEPYNNQKKYDICWMGIVGGKKKWA